MYEYSFTVNNRNITVLLLYICYLIINETKYHKFENIIEDSIPYTTINWRQRPQLCNGIMLINTNQFSITIQLSYTCRYQISLYISNELHSGLLYMIPYEDK